MYQEISKLLMYGDLPQDEILYKLGQLFEQFEVGEYNKTELVRDINTNVVGKTPSKALVEGAISVFDELTGVLGLVYNRKTETLDSDIEALIEARTNARKEKNWAEADRIRDQLKEMGIVLEDTAQGVKWHRE